jgi:alkylation response protein AidB-like acyl-CoA dehydrogenase
MNLDLTDDQRQMRDLVREFARNEVEPGAAERDQQQTFPLEVVKKMGELGLFGLPIPEEFGGLGADALTWALVMEELGHADSSVAVTLSVASGLAGGMIVRYGTRDQRERWLPPIATGEMLAGFALTEPSGGSDVKALRTTAKLADGSWTIDGSKAFITNSGTPITGFLVVACQTDDPPRDVSTIIVPADTDGLVIGSEYDKMGWRSTDTHEVVFQGCTVPEGNLLGERGRGLRQCLASLDDGRISIAAISVGLAQACLDTSLRYAQEREAFGRPIGSFEAIAFKLADMRASIEAARLLTWEAAWTKDQGRDYSAAAAAAKLRASDVANVCAREAIQIHGGYGYTEEFPVSRYYRDAKILEIGEGTSEILRLVIARDLGLSVDI